MKAGNGKNLPDRHQVPRTASRNPSTPPRWPRDPDRLSPPSFLMLASSTQEIMNPVSDACEAAILPCVSFMLPWQAWSSAAEARRARRGRPTGARTTSSFGVADFAITYSPSSHLDSDRARVKSASCPVRTTPTATRCAHAQPPLMEEADFKVVDTSPYNDRPRRLLSPGRRSAESNDCRIWTRSRSRPTSRPSGSRPTRSA